MTGQVKQIQYFLDHAFKQVLLCKVCNGQCTFTEDADTQRDHCAVCCVADQQADQQYDHDQCKKRSTCCFREKAADTLHQVADQKKGECTDSSKDLTFGKGREKQSDRKTGAAKQEKAKDCHIGRNKGNAAVLCHDQRIKAQDHNRKQERSSQRQIFSKYDLPYRDR